LLLANVARLLNNLSHAVLNTTSCNCGAPHTQLQVSVVQLKHTPTAPLGHVVCDYCRLSEACNGHESNGRTLTHAS
jgi:hypothetical protein